MDEYKVREEHIDKTYEQAQTVDRLNEIYTRRKNQRIKANEIQEEFKNNNKCIEREGKKNEKEIMKMKM